MDNLHNDIVFVSRSYCDSCIINCRVGRGHYKRKKVKLMRPKCCSSGRTIMHDIVVLIELNTESDQLRESTHLP